MNMMIHDPAGKTDGRPVRGPVWTGYIAMAEGLALLGALRWLEWSGMLEVSALPVHPYLFVVILMSAQYGLYGGIYAAMAATILTYFDQWPVRAIDQPYFDFVVTAWAHPLSWIAAALAVGIIATRRQRELARKTAALQAAETAQALIATQNDVLVARTHRLERRLAGLSEGGEPIPLPMLNLVEKPRPHIAVRSSAQTRGKERPGRVHIDVSPPDSRPDASSE